MEGYRQKYVDESTGEEIKHWDEASNVHYQDGKLNVPRLNSETVQGAIEELAKRSTNPVPSQGTGSSDTYYLIKADEWGLTKSDHLPIRGKHYVKNDTYIQNVASDSSYDTSITYEQMHLNSWGIERAIQYAYNNGYAGVILERGIYYIIPENLTYITEKEISNSYNTLTVVQGNVTPGSRASINIYGIDNFEVNLNGSTLCSVVDSNPFISSSYEDWYRNPYYTSFTETLTYKDNNGTTIKYSNGAKPVQGYSILAHAIIISCCKNVKLCNGVIRGDVYTRNFTSQNERWQEDTYGVSNGLYCENITLESLDISGFTGDSVGTGGGEVLYLRDDRETIVEPVDMAADPVESDSPIDNPNYTKYSHYFNVYHHPTTNYIESVFLDKIRPNIKYTLYSVNYNAENRTATIKVANNKPVKQSVYHFNHGWLWFKGPGYAQYSTAVYPIANASAFCTLSLFLNLQTSNLVYRTGDAKKENKSATIGLGTSTNSFKPQYYYEYLGEVKSSGDFPRVKELIDKRLYTIFAPTKSKVYWPKFSVLTYKNSDFPVIYNNNYYIYDAVQDEVFVADSSWNKSNTKVDKDSFVGNDQSKVLFCEIVKRVYNPFSYPIGFIKDGNIYYATYNENGSSTSFSYTDSNGNSVSSTSVSGTFGKFVAEHCYPSRVIDSSNTGDFWLLPDEKLIRLQCFYDKGYYGEYTLNTSNVGQETVTNFSFPENVFKGAYDEALSFSGNYPQYIRGTEFVVELYGSRNFIIDKCTIHDNLRGGISAGIKDLIIRNSTFYKVRRKDSDPYIDENGVVPKFGSTTNYSIDIEEGYTSNTEIYNCRFLDNNTILVLSGLNFSFHHNISYASISVRNMVNTNIHHNVFYGGLLNLDWWKLCSAIVLQSDHNSSDDLDIANESFSDTVGNAPGYIDKLNLGGSYIERLININHNVCYNFSFPSRYFWKTVFNINHNTLHIEGHPSAWRTYKKNLDELVDALRLSSCSNNRFIIDTTYFDNYPSPPNSNTSYMALLSNYVVATKYSLPLFGNVNNNTIENKGGSAGTVSVSPLGVGNNNVMRNVSIRLGDRKTSTTNTYQYQGVETFEGFMSVTYTPIFCSFGDPTVTSIVKSCVFKGDTVLYATYYPITKNSDGTNLRSDPPEIHIVSGTTSADKSRKFYVTYPQTMTAQTRAISFLAYSLDGSNFIYVDENEEIEIFEDSCVMASVTVQAASFNENNITSEIAVQTIYVNHYYMDDELGRVGVEIEDPDSYVYENYDNYPDTIDPDEPRHLYLKFVECTFYKPINIPPIFNSGCDGYKTILHIIFDRCDFTYMSSEDNYAVKITNNIDTSGTLSGLSSGKIYYDTDTKQYVRATGANVVDLNRTTVVEFINCATNSNFAIHKTQGGITLPLPKYIKALKMTQAAYNNLGQPEDDVLYLIEDNNA